MSDENTPKLRLRPKLAGGPPAVTPSPATPPVETAMPEASAPSPAAALTEAKPVILRPKLALKAEEPVKVDEPAGLPPPPPEVEPGPYLHDPREFPPPPAKQLQVAPRLRPSLSPSVGEKSPADSGAAPPFPLPADKDKLPAVLNAPPPRLLANPAPQETWPAVLNAPPPPGLAPSIIPSVAEEEPAEITAIRKASTFPFPAPTAKFPPLPGLVATGDTAPPESSEQEGFLKKLLLIGTVAVLILGAAGAFAYFKFFAKPAVKPVALPAAAAGQAVAEPGQPKDKVSPADKKPKDSPARSNKDAVATTSAPLQVQPPATTAPLTSVPTAGTAVVTPPSAATQEPAVAPEPPPVVVKPPPPQPSLAFKAWVINLRIRGVRGGDAQRVFIDKTSYVPGDVVNQQLGIIFVGYDESARMLTFQDKSGAVFERRH